MYVRAAASLEEGLTRATSVLGKMNSLTLTFLSLLGELRMEEGQFQTAVDLLERCARKKPLRHHVGLKIRRFCPDKLGTDAQVAPVLSLSCHFRCVFILLGVSLQGAGFAAEGSGAALPDPRGDNEHPQPACAGADRAIRKPAELPCSQISLCLSRACLGKSFREAFSCRTLRQNAAFDCRAGS